MNKRIIAGTIITAGLLVVPMAAQARHGADDPAGHVRQEDRQLGRQEDKTVNVPTTQGTTNAATTPAGNVLSVTSSNDNTTPAPTATDATTTLEEAIAKAKALFADKTVAKTETEQEHGTTVYEIKFTDGSEVEIDATTGEVIESRDRALEDNSGHGNSHEDESQEDHSGSRHN